MKRITIGRVRKDGKFPVTYWYQGACNMFGGYDYPNVYKKLHTRDKIATNKLYPGDELINNSGLSDGYFFGDKDNED